MKKIIITILSLIMVVGLLSRCELWEENCPTCPRESTARKWTDGIVYYKFHDNVTEDAKDIIVDCMMDFEDISSLQFIEDDSKKYFVTIKLGEFNGTSDVGMHKNLTTIIYDINKKIVYHEIGHIIGLEHEHQRSDRNKYIKIIWDNIQQSKYNNFIILGNSLIPVNLFNYDKKSFLHYSVSSFSKNGKQTIKSKNGNIFDFIDFFENIYTLEDIKKIKYVYPN